MWSLALSIGDNGEATATDLREHTAELGGAALGSVSSFGLDADGELLIAAYARGNVIRVLGPPGPPPVPTGLRIIRP